MGSATPLIKVCGITSIEDARFSLEHGADITGVVMSDLSPRRGSRELVREMSGLGAHVAGVYTEMKTIERDNSEEEYIQIHFQHGKEAIHYVKNELGRKAISVVFPLKSREFMQEAEEKLENGADLVLLDFGRDIWDSRVEGLPDLEGRKIALAGKISSSNVVEVLRYHPYLVDLSSSLESAPGRKDHLKIEKFMEVARPEHAPL